jgi:hypothetical protein
MRAAGVGHAASSQPLPEIRSLSSSGLAHLVMFWKTLPRPRLLHDISVTET